jgi:hypothetical protein
MVTNALVVNQVYEVSLIIGNGDNDMCNMNSRESRKWFKFLRKRDGGFCQMCKISRRKRKLVVDHIDNDNNHTYPDNLQLLCYPCNYKKNPRLSEREPFDNVCVGVTNNHNTNNDHLSTIPTEIMINKDKEPKFIIHVKETIDKHGKWEERDLINSGAQIVGISPVTAMRYLNKLCSSAGIYMRITIDKQTFITKRPTV